MLKSVREGTVGEGLQGGMSADAGWDVAPGGEAGHARVLGESGFGDAEAIRRRWRKGSRRCGDGAVSVTDETVTSTKAAMTGISNFGLRVTSACVRWARLPSVLS